MEEGKGQRMSQLPPQQILPTAASLPAEVILYDPHSPAGHLWLYLEESQATSY